MDPTLNNDGLLGVIAAITARRESGRLQIIGPGTRGAFFFRDGKLVNAHMGPFSGFPAVNLAISIGKATLNFDSSIPPPQTTALISNNERLLLKERFGIETSDLHAGENQGAVPERPNLPILLPDEVAHPEVSHATEATDIQQRANKNFPAPEGRTGLRESRRRVARNRVAGRQKNKKSGIGTEPMAEEVRATVSNNQNFAIPTPEGENATRNAAPAKPLEHRIGELEVNPGTESIAEPASPGWVYSPARTQVSSAVQTLQGEQNKRCPTCNRVYDDSTNYCPYDSTELVSQRDASLNVGREPQVSPRTVLFWTLIIVTFLLSVVCSYWLNSYLSRQPGVSTQSKVEPNEPAKVEQQPVVEGALRGKEVTLVMPEYPASAKTTGVTGEVTVSVLVNKQGVVVLARALKGDQLLRAAAVTAAKKSKFSAEKLVGEQSRTSGTITYSFKP